MEYVYQELDCLPEGFTVPEGRVKPWGTNHAILVARDAVHEPFAVINADDFYGAEAFRTIAEYLRGLDGASGRYCMVAYELSRTLSENGTVSRGVCSVNAAGDLTGMVEHTPVSYTHLDVYKRQGFGQVGDSRRSAAAFTGDHLFGECVPFPAGGAASQPFGGFEAAVAAEECFLDLCHVVSFFRGVPMLPRRASAFLVIIPFPRRSESR